MCIEIWEYLIPIFVPYPWRDFVQKRHYKIIKVLLLFLSIFGWDLLLRTFQISRSNESGQKDFSSSFHIETGGKWPFLVKPTFIVFSGINALSSRLRWNICITDSHSKHDVITFWLSANVIWIRSRRHHCEETWRHLM